MTAQYKYNVLDLVCNSADGSIIPGDPNAPERIAFTAWAKAGNVPDPFIPVSVTPRQARLALLGAGLLDQANAAVAAADKATQLTWEFAAEIDRSSTMVASLGASLGLTSAQIDNLFIRGAGL